MLRATQAVRQLSTGAASTAAAATTAAGSSGAQRVGHQAKLRARFVNAQAYPPPNPNKSVEHLPFRIERTASKQLPVYTDVKFRGSRVRTIVRKYRGNEKALKETVQAVVGPEFEIESKVGRLEVRGRHAKKLKEFFADLGF